MSPAAAIPEAGLPSPPDRDDGREAQGGGVEQVPPSPPEARAGRGAGDEGPLASWIAATRPRTLPAAAVPVLVGTALAHAFGALAAGPAFAALFGALAIQVGTNFANDLFDGLRGTDGPDRKGPPRMVATGRITPRAMAAGCAIAFVLATGAGAYLTLHAGWPVIAIGLLSILSGLAYTSGPYPLAYHGLGDLFVLVFFGPVAVGGTVFVQAGRLLPGTLPLALSVGAIATALLVVNNLRDADEDRGNRKHTLAVLLGRRGALAEHAGLLLGAYGALFALLPLFGPTALVALATAPLAARRHLALREASTGPEFNAELAATGKLLTLHGLALLAALLLPGALT